jgi:hypothetical protein
MINGIDQNLLVIFSTIHGGTPNARTISARIAPPADRPGRVMG